MTTIWLPSVVIPVLLLGGLGLVTAVITDGYGNTINDDKTITWASVPVNLTYKDSGSYEEGQFYLLFAFARSFVNTVQPNDFPFDIIKDMASGSFNISERYMELVNYAMGFGVCFILGVLYIVCMPLCGCCFCCCRCCGNCGGEMTQTYDENEDCKKMGFAQALFLLSICLLASAGCVYFTNDKFTSAINYGGDAVDNNLDNIGLYINNTAIQFGYIAKGMYDIVGTGVITDITGLGDIIKDAIMKNLQITPVIDAVIELDKAVNEISTNLGTVITDINSLQAAANTLTSTMNTLSTDLTTTKTGCSADCTPSTVCDSINPSDFSISADFSSLPDLTSTKTSIDDVVSKNLTGIALSAKSSLDGIGSTVDSATNSMRTSLQTTMDTFKSTLNTMVDDLLVQLQGSFDVSSLKLTLGALFKTAQDYDIYRVYFGYGLTGMFTTFPIIFILAIMCGCCCIGSDTRPTERSCCPSCGGCLMIFAVGMMFMVGTLLMLLTTLTFMVGGNLELICRTLLDLTIFSKFLDTGVVDGFNLGSLILGNASASLSMYKLMLGCKNNKAPFTLLSLDQIVPLDDYTNISKYMGDIDTQINSISTSTTLSGFQVLTPDMENTLNDFKNSGISGINFTAINSTLDQSISGLDLNVVITSFTTIKSQCSGTTDTRWGNHISTVTTMRDTELPAVEAAQAKLKTSVNALEGSLSGITDKIDNVLNTAREADNQIQNNITQVMLNAAIDFKNQMLGYVDSYVNRVKYLVYNEIGACFPLWNLYDSITVLLCKYMVDALNGFWFSLGWGLFFFLPSIIIAAKLSRYYRKMNEEIGYGDDEKTDLGEKRDNCDF